MEAHQLSQEAFDRLQAELDDLTDAGPHRGGRRRSSGPASSATSRRTATTTPPRTSRATWRAASASSRRSSRTPRSSRRPSRASSAGTIVTIVYEGDADDDAERYLVGHIEERTDGLDVISPTAPLGAALLGAGPATPSPTRRPNGASCASGSSRWRQPEPHGLGRAERRRTPSWPPLDDAHPPTRRRRSSRPPLPPARDVELPAGTVHAPRARRTARRADGRAAARLDGDGRPQLLHAATRRSASTSACSPSTTAVTAAASARRRSSGSRTAPTTSPAMADASGSTAVVAVGYSMGGAVAQLLWRRHPRPRRGLVPGRHGAALQRPAQRAARRSSGSPGSPRSPGSRRPRRGAG